MARDLRSEVLSSISIRTSSPTRTPLIASLLPYKKAFSWIKTSKSFKSVTSKNHFETAYQEISICSTATTTMMFASMPLDVDLPPKGRLKTPSEIPDSPAIMLKLVDTPAARNLCSSARHLGSPCTFALSKKPNAQKQITMTMWRELLMLPTSGIYPSPWINSMMHFLLITQVQEILKTLQRRWKGR